MSIAHLAAFVFAFAQYNKIEVKSVLDIGAGIGLWKHWIEKHAKGTQYGHRGEPGYAQEARLSTPRHRALARSQRKHDLIVRQGVLQYLPDPDVAPAVANIAAMSRGLVYVEVTTRQDLRERCDNAAPDTDIYVRNGSYYRGILSKHLLSVGRCGLWWAKIARRPSSNWRWQADGGRKIAPSALPLPLALCLGVTALGAVNYLRRQQRGRGTSQGRGVRCRSRTARSAAQARALAFRSTLRFQVEPRA